MQLDEDSRRCTQALRMRPIVRAVLPPAAGANHSQDVVVARAVSQGNGAVGKVNFGGKGAPSGDLNKGIKNAERAAAPH